MSWSNPEQQDSGQLGREPENPDNPMQLLIGAGAVFAICAFLTSFLPGALAFVVLEGLLFWAAMGYMVRAILTRQRWSFDRLNAWDQSLLMLAASIAVGLFVDPAAVEALAAGAGATPS